MEDNPTLNREHVDRIRSVAQLRSVRSGEVLYEPACPDVPLFVVLDGTVSISRTGEDEKILAVREPGQFTGEMSVISGSRSLLTARVTKDGAVLELTREKVLSLMAKDTELGDILMGAFVARRLLMIQMGEGNVILFGTRSSARTLALREFLTRNGHPFAYVDIDTDTCAGELMEKLAVRNGEIPVVYCNRRYVLRDPSIAELAACLDLNINVEGFLCQVFSLRVIASEPERVIVKRRQKRQRKLFKICAARGRHHVIKCFALHGATELDRHAEQSFTSEHHDP
jgi:thioredoxin reductase (NADPH)